MSESNGTGKETELKIRCTRDFKARVERAAELDGITATAWITQTLTLRMDGRSMERIGTVPIAPSVPSSKPKRKQRAAPPKRT